MSETSEDAAEAALHRDRRRWPTVLLALVLVAMIAAVGLELLSSWNQARERQGHFCEMVGLINTPVARTPDAAMSAYLGRDASNWKRLPRSANGANAATENAVVYQDRHRASHSISVSPTAGGWAASGGCV